MEKPRQVPAFLFPSLQEEETCWRPSVDIHRSRDGWLLKFDLAGVRPEDVRVQVHGCRITVTGVRRDLLSEETASYYSMEIAYNRFERTVELPCSLTNPQLTIEARHGFLIVRVQAEE